MCPIRITPFLKGVANRLSATDDLPGVIPALFIIRSVSAFVNIFHAFPGIFRLSGAVLPQIFFSQHQTSTALSGTCGGNRPTPSLPRSLLCSPTSTPKPRAEGSSPSAPATKPAETLRFCRFSFYMCCMVMVFTLVQTAAFRIRLSLPTTVLILSST